MFRVYAVREITRNHCPFSLSRFVLAIVRRAQTCSHVLMVLSSLKNEKKNGNWRSDKFNFLLLWSLSARGSGVVWSFMWLTHYLDQRLLYLMAPKPSSGWKLLESLLCQMCLMWMCDRSWCRSWRGCSLNLGNTCDSVVYILAGLYLIRL